MSEVLFVSFRKELPFLEKIKTGIEEHFDFIAANRELPVFIFKEVMNDEKLRKVFINNLKPKIIRVMQQLQNEINKEVEKGTIRYIESYDLVMTIVSLNVFVFVSLPVITEVKNFTANESEKYIRNRKQINVETILNQLRI